MGADRTKALGDTVQPSDAWHVSAPCHDPTAGHAHAWNCSSLLCTNTVVSAIRATRAALAKLRSKRRSCTCRGISCPPLLTRSSTRLRLVSRESHANEEQIDPESRLFRRLHRAENFAAGKGRFAAERLTAGDQGASAFQGFPAGTSVPCGARSRQRSDNHVGVDGFT